MDYAGSMGEIELINIVFTYGNKEFCAADRGFYLRNGINTASSQDFDGYIGYDRHLGSATMD